MQVEITFLTRRGTDAVMRKSQTVTVESVRFGRGSKNEVQLRDTRVGLAAATLYQRDGGFFIEQSGDVPLRINDATASAARVGTADTITIGPYKVVIGQPPNGIDLLLTVELVHPPGDALQRLVAQSRIGLDQAGIGKRAASWALFAFIAIFGLAAPIAVYPVGQVASSSKSVPPADTLSYFSMIWNSGEFSNPHRFFGQACATCHRSSFAAAPDAACLTCHAEIGNHFKAAAAADLGPARQHLEGTRCAACHEEHRGLRGLTIRQAALCVDCHGSLAESAPKAGLRNVSSFPAGHPQFRATLVADAAKRSFVRSTLGSEPKPADHPNLTFSHAAHLIETGLLTAKGREIMGCADCHLAEPGGEGFLPITFKGQCQSCHHLDLKFDIAQPWREVPHGDAAAVKVAVEDFYGHKALKDGILDTGPPAILRRAVGTAQVDEQQRRDALAWVTQKSREAMGTIFDEKRGCGYCHVVDRANDAFTVAPVAMRARFLPGARFNHARHAAMACADCHDSRHSEKSSDVLLPGLESCITCHGPEQAALMTRSTCTSCHDFHRKEFGPMRRATRSGT
jgi:predicted CXXCH cytochrome family protein